MRLARSSSILRLASASRECESSKVIERVDGFSGRAQGRAAVGQLRCRAIGGMTWHRSGQSMISLCAANQRARSRDQHPYVAVFQNEGEPLATLDLWIDHQKHAGGLHRAVEALRRFDGIVELNRDAVLPFEPQRPQCVGQGISAALHSAYDARRVPHTSAVLSGLRAALSRSGTGQQHCRLDGRAWRARNRTWLSTESILAGINSRSSILIPSASPETK